MTQFATAKAGRSSSTSIRPTVRRARYALNKVGCRRYPGAGAQDQRLTQMRVATRRRRRQACRTLEHVIRLGRRRAGHAELRRRADASDNADQMTLAEPAPAAVRRPHQHPVHPRHDRAPEGRDAHPPQHPEQRLLRRRGACGSRPRTASASPCRSTTASAWCSAISPACTHGSTMVYPGEAFDPLATLQTVARGALHGALRRADDVHRRARPPAVPEFDLSSLRTGIMAGSPCPIEVMKRVRATCT